MPNSSMMAVLRAHMHSLEVMAAQCEEMARRSVAPEDWRQLHEFSKKFELLAIEHRRLLDELTTKLSA